jgi:deoxyribose-phosphate aldolase
MAFAPARVDAVMLEARAAQLFGRVREGDAKRNATAAAGALLELDAVSGGATPGTVRRACAAALGAGSPAPAAVVVTQHFAPVALGALAAVPVRVAVAVGGGDDLAAALAAGAHELELALDASSLLAGRPEAAFEQIAAAKRACGDVPLKVVIGARELGSRAAFARAAGLALAAGADFLKTAHDTEARALPALALLLSGVVREYARRGGRAAGLALTGADMTADARAGCVSIVSETLGAAWLGPERLRIGARIA